VLFFYSVPNLPPENRMKHEKALQEKGASQKSKASEIRDKKRYSLEKRLRLRSASLKWIFLKKPGGRTHIRGGYGDSEMRVMILYH